ncbi:MAG: hypothetical protein ACRD52_08955 [Candidatus Acidiferrales bacterium]
MSNHSAAAFRALINTFPRQIATPTFAINWQHQRENGYISQAMPTLTSTNRANVHTAYLIRPAALRHPRHASATDTKAANSSIAEKWLMCMA